MLSSPTSCLSEVETSKVDSLFAISLVLLLSYVTAVHLTSLSIEKIYS